MFFQALTHKRSGGVGSVSPVVLAVYEAMQTNGTVQSVTAPARCIRQLEVTDGHVRTVERELMRHGIPYRKSTNREE